MRKLKLLLATCALLGGVFSANAQTDVTSTYMDNPSFEKAGATTGDISATGVITDDWNVTALSYARVAIFNSSSTVSTYGGTTSASDGNYYLMIRSNLDQGKTQNIKQDSDMPLPKGRYTICFDYKAARVKDVNRNLTISAIDGSSTLGSSTIAILKVAANDSYFGEIEWSTSSFDFTIDNITNTRINISCETQGTANSGSSQHTVVLLDNFVIQYSNINVSNLATLIAQATAINTKISTLTDAIAAAQTVYDNIDNTPAYQATIDGAIETLQEAINEKVAAYSADPTGDDVSVLYIWNNGFDVDINFASSSSTATAANTVYPTFGWTPTVPGNCTAATIGYGYSGNINGEGNVTAPTQNADETTAGGALAICVGWSGEVTYKSLVKTFAAGSYRITYRAYNGNTNNTTAVEAIPLVGFVPTSGTSQINSITETFANQAWSTHTYDFVLADDTEGQIQIGLKPTSNTNSYNAPELFIDEVKLEFFDPLALAQLQWQDVHDALDALDEDALPESAKAAITEELAKSVPTTSVDDVNNAKAALQALIDSYDGIKAAYDDYKTLKAQVEDLKNTSKYTFTGDEALSTFNTTLSDINTNAEAATDAATLTDLLPSLKTAGNTFVGAIESNDGFDLTYNVENNSFETGVLSPWTTNGSNDTGVRENSNGTYTTTGVDGSYLFNTWNNGAGSKVSQTLSSLPEGYYTVTALVASDAGNTINILAGASTKGIASDATDGKGKFVEGTTDKTLVSDGSLEIGTNSSTWYKSDYFRLTYYTVKAGAAEAWAAAKAAAEAARDDAAYTNVTGSERTDLLAEIAKTEPSTAEAYGTATTALQEKTSAFIAAKPSYDAFEAAKAVEYENNLPYASATKFAAIATAQAATATSADDATTKTAAIISAYRKYVESNALAEGVDGAEDLTEEKISDPNMDVTYDGTAHTFGAWQVFGQTDGTINLKTESDEPLTDSEGHLYKYADIWKTDNNGGIKQTLENLPAGKYMLTAAARAQNASGATFGLFAGSARTEIPRNNNTGGVFGNGWNDVSLEFYVTETSDVNIGVQSGNGRTMWWGATRFRLVRLGDAIESVTITAAGMATYASDYDLDFTNVEGLTAYKATVSGTTASFTEVTKVPAGEGVLLVGAADTYNIPVTTGVTAWAAEDNAFIRGAGEAVATEAGDYKNYILSTDNDGNNVGFYYANGETVPTNKAYLQSNAGNGARLTLVFEDATGIASLVKSAEVKSEQLFNLNGQRVTTPKRGLYIVNGKKIIKN